MSTLVEQLSKVFQAAQPKRMAGDPQLMQMWGEVVKQYPALGKHPFVITRGAGPGHAETYPYYESHSPMPGVNVIELRNQNMTPEEIKSTLAGEALHVLSGIDPTTQQPVDPNFRKFKDQFINSLTPEQLTFERMQFRSGNPDLGVEGRDFKQWFETSRADAYLRGYLFPDKADEWRQSGTYTGQQYGILQEAQKYLTTPPSSSVSDQDIQNYVEGELKLGLLQAEVDRLTKMLSRKML